MKKKIILVGILMMMGAIQAQEVITFNKIIESQDLSAHKAKDSQQEGKTFVDINEALFEEGVLREGQEIMIETPTGKELLEIKRVSEYIKGIISIRAISMKDASKVFTFSYTNGRIIGLFHESHARNYHFKYDRDKKAYFITDKKEEGLACANEDLSLLMNTNSREVQLQAKKGKPADVDADFVRTVFTPLNSTTTIDVMIVYTSNASFWARSNSDFDRIDDVIAQSMNLAQSALDNSSIPIKLRLVHTYRTGYKEGFTQSSGDLLRLITASKTISPLGISDPEGAMDEVHELRDQYGADLVALFASLNDGSGGVAFRMSDRTGIPELAYSVNRIEQVGYGYTMIHEMGHNTGLLHSRTQSSQQAPVTGGVFQESVGFQNFEDNVSTVMAYPFAGSTDIPAFSNPSVFFDRKRTGFSGKVEVANAALSLKKMKSVISSYRLTKIDAPSASISTDKLDVSLNPAETASIQVSISNKGSSTLDYDADFELNEAVILKQKRATEKAFLNESIIYQTSFESNFGSVGPSFEALSNWRSFSGSDITLVNAPSEGTQNLRLLNTGRGSEKNIYGHYIGALRFGSYKVRFDVKLSEVENSNNDRFEINLYDGKTRERNSGLRIENGFFSALERTENGSSLFRLTKKEIVQDKYYSIEIDYNSDTKTITYYIDSERLYEVPFFKSGNTPSEVIISSTNGVSGAYIDIDNYSVSRYASPTSWLSISGSSDLVNTSSSKNISLNFNSTGLETGTYSLLLTVQTNDAENPRFEVPVTLTVSGAVSNETDTEIASEITLNQNYPNPFNPETNISYSISKVSNVVLEVYSIQGKKVATLENKRKPAGEYSIRFDGSNLSSGVYIYQLKTNSQVLTKQMVLIK